MTEKVGYAWLAHQYGVEAVHPLPVTSEIGSGRRTVHTGDFTHEIYAQAVRPKDDFQSHMTFALKHEGVNLELLARLFDAVPVAEIGGWISEERTGQYAKRTGFLYEWLTGRQLDGVPEISGNYVEALDPERYITSTAVSNNTRWRVRDNLPGSRDFCPTIRRTASVIAAENYNPAAEIESLQVEFGADTLLRSATWLTTKESRASFLIEHEQKQVDRIKRFAIVMERDCGRFDNPLARDALTALQKDIIGEPSTLKHFGLRKSPVFVGSSAGFRGEQVDYIAPHFRDVESLISGLETFLGRTRGASSLARAATAAFGFVYIHPLADGNGRIHRFLINDILRRDGAVPAPFLLPVSATIVARDQERAAYNTILESFSKPLMHKYSALFEFGDRRTYDDGVISNFDFYGYDQALPAWRYPDMTAHVTYVSQLVDRTIRQEMRHEARYLHSFTNAVNAVKHIVDGPDPDIHRIIRAVHDNHGHVSNKLRKEFPVLADQSLAADVVEAVSRAFSDQSMLGTTDNDLTSANPEA